MTRAEEAQRLVDEGRIQNILQSDYSTGALVRREQIYHVTTVYADGTFFCTCNWGVTQSHTDDLCVHALALKLVVERDLGDEDKGTTGP